MTKKKQKFYVVWEGREKGIFTDWPTVQKSVSGHPKAKHKSFESEAEAKTAFAASPSASIKASPKKTKKSSSGAAKRPGAAYIMDPDFTIHIFCDGGCDPNPGNAGSGVAVYEKQKLIELHHGLYNPMGTNNTAELNALHQSMLIARSKLELGLSVQILADSTYAIKAMTEWGAGWKSRGWRRKDGELKNAELIAAMYADYLSIAKQISIKHVKGHSGAEGNELADRLSMITIKHKIKGFVRYEGSESVAEILAMQSG